MDEEISWRARLARSNINILNIDEGRWYYEFMYHPRPGQTKWCKTFYSLDDGKDRYYLETTHSHMHEAPERIAEHVMADALRLRKELER